MDDLALRCQGLVKSYGALVALAGVDIDVPAGSVHALLGPNGAGKTTIMRAVLGLVRLDSGEIRIGSDEGGRRPGPAQRPGSAATVGGFVEEPRFYPYLSGRKNLELVARLDDAGSGAAAVDSALDAVSLSSRAGDRVRDYSYGMRQRLGVASAMLRSPTLLVLDEPTNGLDPAGARDLRDLVRRLTDDGTTVLLSSHDMTEVQDLADAVTIVAEGRVAWCGSSEQMRRQAPAPVHHLRTSDDSAAMRIGDSASTMRVRRSHDGVLEISADEGMLDRYVLDLAAAGIAVRSLQLSQSPLESLFFSLTQQKPVSA